MWPWFKRVDAYRIILPLCDSLETQIATLEAGIADLTATIKANPDTAVDNFPTITKLENKASFLTGKIVGLREAAGLFTITQNKK